MNRTRCLRQFEHVARWSAARAAAALQCANGNRRTDGFGILMYHRVVDPSPRVPKPTWNVTPKRLREQLLGLLTRGFRARSLSSAVTAHLRGESIPSNVFVVTFDDGYENNYSHALPVLRELNVPATIFLATKYLDSDRSFPFDDWSAAGSSSVPACTWRPLATSQCHEMLGSGLIEFGAHTHSHERFRGRCDEFGRDLALCLHTLRTKFGIEQPAFACPFGEVDAEMLAECRRQGLACCVTSNQKRVHQSDSAYDWGRFVVSASDTVGVLAAKISGWYTTVSEPAKSLRQVLARNAWGAERNLLSPLNEAMARL
jgi:peptidoglycan/xylan/chitin deacetylase (PgdA/CDA1 family)